MPGIPPTSVTFPSTITCSIIPCPSSPTTPPANILILLHSLGDTHESFAKLAQNLNLPETTCISLRAPKIMPFDLPGYQWGEDVMFTGADLAMDAKFERAGYVAVKTVVDKLLETGWRTREIIFFGWGQGAICAFDYLCREPSNMEKEFGGLVSIGGVVGGEVKTVVIDEAKKSGTPVLVCGGRQGLVDRRAEDRVKSLFRDVQVVRWDRNGDGMMRDREEAMPVMRFFSRRLLSRRGVPEGFNELA